MNLTSINFCISLTVSQIEGSFDYLRISNNRDFGTKKVKGFPVFDPSNLNLQCSLILIAMLKLKQYQLCIFQVMHIQGLNDSFIFHMYLIDLVSF